MHYLPFNSFSQYLQSENEINSLTHLKKKIVFFSSSSYIRRIAILHRIIQYNDKKKSKNEAFKFLTKDGNNLIFFWSPISDKNLEKITISICYESEDHKLVCILRSMLEIKIDKVSR